MASDKRATDAASWKQLVTQVIVVLEALGDEDGRNLARHGWARVRYGDHFIDVPEENIEFAAAMLRQRVQEDTGRHAAERLDEPIVERRGLKLGNRLCRGNHDLSTRGALNQLVLDLAKAGDFKPRNGEPDVVGLEYGRALKGADRSNYLSALGAIRQLLERPRFSDAIIAQVLGTLRTSLGRSTRTPGSGTDKKVKALRMAMENPEMTSKKIAELVGVSVKTLTNRDRWGPEMDHARAQGRRDRAPDAADRILGNRGRRVRPKADRPESA